MEKIKESEQIQPETFASMSKELANDMMKGGNNLDQSYKAILYARNISKKVDLMPQLTLYKKQKVLKLDKIDGENLKTEQQRSLDSFVTDDSLNGSVTVKNSKAASKRIVTEPQLTLQDDLEETKDLVSNLPNSPRGLVNTAKRAVRNQLIDMWPLSSPERPVCPDV